MIRIAILLACLGTIFNEHAELQRHTRTTSSTTMHASLDPVTLLTRYQLECIEQTRVNSDAIVKIKHRNWSMSWEQLRLVKEWALCVLMKSGVMTKEGVYKIDVAMHRVPMTLRADTEKKIDSCLTKYAIPAVDIAFKYIKCFQWFKSNQSAVVSAF